MYVPASPEHVPAIPDQLPVEPPLAPNPPELDNDYLDAVDYDEEEDPEEDLEMDLDEEEEDPKMDVDDEEEEEPLPASPPPLSPLRTPPPVSESSSDSDIPVTTTTTVGRPFKGPLSTYEVGEPSSVASASVFSARYELNQLRQDFGILGSRVQSLTRGMGTRRTEIAEAHKEAIRARRHQVKNREEIQRLKNQVQSANISATLAAMDRDRIDKTQDQEGKQIQELRHRLTSVEIRLEFASVDRIMPPKRMSNAAIERMVANRVAAALATERTATAAEDAKVSRAAVAAETTRAATTTGGAGGSNNAGPATGAGGPNVAGPTVGSVAMNVVPKVRGCSYKEFMSCQPTNFKGTEGAVGLACWFERSESVFLINKCAENDKVKYVTSTLLDEALSWWNSVAQPIGIENAYKIRNPGGSRSRFSIV
ncbi:hypothetical protein Tco_1136398 [Tanacetum coccineum]